MIYDVCIVGSGPGGGIATYVLAKAGLKIADDDRLHERLMRHVVSEIHAMVE